MIQRGEDFGLSPSVARDIVEPWLHAELSKHVAKFGDWDWNYAEAYPLMKHRMAVIISEAVRLNQNREDLGKLGNYSYDDAERLSIGSSTWMSVNSPSNSAMV